VTNSSIGYDFIVGYARQCGSPFDANDITYEVVVRGVSNLTGDLISMLVDLGDLRLVSAGPGPWLWELSDGQPKI
jgi:hypothetical protein